MTESHLYLVRASLEPGAPGVEYLYEAPSPGLAVRAVLSDHDAETVTQCREVRKAKILNSCLLRGHMTSHTVTLLEERKYNITDTKLAKELHALRRTNFDGYILVHGPNSRIDSFYRMSNVAGVGSYETEERSEAAA